jgi:hypothetical protein
MDAKPKRRWYQFSLRTIFVLVFVVSIPLAWVGYSLNWIRQRQEYRKRYYTGMGMGGTVSEITGVRAPGGLWLFGESGYFEMNWSGDPKNKKECQRLFPESKLSEASFGPGSIKSGIGTGVF